jgi:peptidoglycan/LPS O-acetylase OafA/YrhL
MVNTERLIAMEKEKIHSIELIRAIAMFLIVYAHASFQGNTDTAHHGRCNIFI